MLGTSSLSGDLEAHIGAFVDDYNHRRYHGILQNLAPTNVCFGEAEPILRKRQAIHER